MTRINTVDVQSLTDQHLMAEYRELPMVNASLKRSLNSKRGFDINRIPKKYTLNSGHVTFFYDKGKWLHDRYQSLISELRNRNFDINPDERTVDWNVFIDYNLYNDWTPTQESKSINAERIIQRIEAKRSWYRYYRQAVVDELFVENFKLNCI